MDNPELDAFRQSYRSAVDEWIAAIREEEGLATADHSIKAIDAWEHAGFAEEERRRQAKEAKAAYESALRKTVYSI